VTERRFNEAEVAAIFECAAVGALRLPAGHGHAGGRWRRSRREPQSLLAYRLRTFGTATLRRLRRRRASLNVN